MPERFLQLCIGFKSPCMSNSWVGETKSANILRKVSQKKKWCETKMSRYRVLSSGRSQSCSLTLSVSDKHVPLLHSWFDLLLHSSPNITHITATRLPFLVH
ncbi:hypothetical protein AMECASPLE_018151 [Ameca splendens]|uniref:Uncharacterized protein n=1 Tax=Ameca splendens TaxID=208324 RepID=A0ABV0ZMH0_9TELE